MDLIKMYKYKKPKGTGLAINTSIEGETIETKVERIVQNREPITDGAPLVYTDKKLGVQAGYDVRTDRFEYAVEAMDKVHKDKVAKGNQATIEKKDDGRPESIEGTQE